MRKIPHHKRAKSNREDRDNGKPDIIDNEPESKESVNTPPIAGTDYDDPDKLDKIPERSEERPEGARGTRSHRLPLAREIDRTRIIQLMSRGYTVPEIAKMMKLGQQTVYNDYKTVLKEMREQRKELTEEIIEAKLLEYREIKKEAWDAWERSKSSHITTKVKETTTAGLAGKANYENSQVTETRVGDNSYLAVVLECIKAERELQGLDPEKKMRLTGEMINWDILASGVPVNGPVPDLIEQEIKKGMELDNRIMNGVDSNTIYISKSSDENILVPNGENKPNNQKEITLDDLENENINLATEPIEQEK